MDNQDYYWTDEWQEGEKEADKDITTGNYVEFSSANSVIAYLRSLSNTDEKK